MNSRETSLPAMEATLLWRPDRPELRFLPEGPTPLQPGVFSWVAIQHGPDATMGSINIFDIARQSNRSIDLPGRPGFAKPTTVENVFIVGCERSLGFFHTLSGQWEPLVSDIDADVEGTIINDGTIYGNNVLFGTKDLEFATPKASLYLFRGDENQLVRLAGGQVCSNGKDVIDRGAGGLFLLDIDSPTRKLVQYPLDLAGGRLGEPQTLIDFGDVPGVPDGMVLTPDEQSAIISFYNPDPAPFGITRQYSLLNGQPEFEWRTPGSPRATCPALVEDASGKIVLIITTAVEFMPQEQRAQAPNAGCLFVAETDFNAPPLTPRFPLQNA
ncbi:MAG: gluconolactonase [Pirellulaceae bacterium]|nr:MAG: gluconolactonase [Pirellulaceae bacterium]